MQTKRPRNINPLSIQLPIGALVSITHRLSGILVFLLIPFFLWALQLSLISPEGFNSLKDHLQLPFYKVTAMLAAAGLIFHLLAGFRHILMDLHIGESKTAGRISAKLVISLSLLLLIFAVYWLGGVTL
ncbi:succinate dehydrogenase, cytochrome b556 subunit [Candidatus Berkiella aquae]|uniref:Succinate dehydrogenase cytochrome b556 subunit n=1 Tax=Candidatus Berkiella aquae TaxID=295108 RepID=A0A0Q9Z0L3_9GAMM|nr:succinate dehydrogenase, cytochrome b556 subunit [Candidatus Berkiella aquae]MCS5712052.1 succinate dehydrogenase, cytochrome b556 subunit [Candidatus Berkiella aquae]